VAHGLAWRGGEGADTPLILGYHRVVADLRPDAGGVPGMAVSAETLERHLDHVGRHRRFVSLDELGERLEAGQAASLAAVTFDDGYLDFEEHAFPLLQRKGIPAAIFVVTGLLRDGSAFLHDRLYAALAGALAERGAAGARALVAGLLPGARLAGARPFAWTRTLLRASSQGSLLALAEALEALFGPAPNAPRSLRWDDLRAMSRRGLTVASHTRSHALLTRESAERVRDELAGSRAELERGLGRPVRHFAYPDGSFDAAAVRAVAAAGYRYGYTVCGHGDPRHPLLTLRRRVLWEGATLGALGGFSRNVLRAQLQGRFDFAQRCRDAHAGAAPRPRVALVAPSLDAVGGQSVQAALLREGLRREGFAAELVPTNPRFPRPLRELRRWRGLRTLLNQALYLPSLLRLRRADVVHVFSASFWSFLLAPLPALLLGRAFGARVILNYHSGEAERHLGRWGLLVHPWLRLAHEIVVPSEYLRRVFARHGYRARVVLNTVDTARHRYRERAPFLPRLLSTRNLESHYRLDVVLDAFAVVKAERPDATLTLAGSGSEQARLRRKAAAIGGVTFAGRVEPAAMPELYASHALLLNASLVDNQPLSLLEAFASGLPVVTTATGDIAGMVRDGASGLLVPPEDAAGMARAVLALLADQELALRLARSARRVADAHAWERVGKEWTDVYSGRSVDAAPLAADADRGGRRSQPPGSLEVA
jgi:glycosyltransferase involved in cell wall biosynthesis/peptidoglycan/xylan/chitin deacetylase (PgdA/CDA1 family)